MGVWRRNPSGVQGQSPWSGGGEVPPLKLKDFEHLALKRYDKFAKLLCILQIPFVSHRWLKKMGLLDG